LWIKKGKAENPIGDRILTDLQIISPLRAVAVFLLIGGGFFWEDRNSLIMHNYEFIEKNPR